MQEKTSTKWIWGTIAIIAVVFIIFALVVDIDALLEIFQHLHLGLFSIGVVFLLMGIVLITIRWRFLLRNEPGFAPTFHANSVSYMLNFCCQSPKQ